MQGKARFKKLASWLAVGTTVGAACGVASAAFLTLLDAATQLREAQAWLVFLLPVAGLVLGACLEALGNPTAAASERIAGTLRQTGPQLPLRLAPTVLLGTVVTHLFGGSAGREGTAVQMGASLADALAHASKSTPTLRRHFLLAGVAGGFGSVFGTPVAAALFALEFAGAAVFDVTCLLTAAVASTVGDFVARSLGIVHAAYPQVPHLPLTVAVCGEWLVFAAAVALVSRCFVASVQRVRHAASRLLPRLPLRMACGGLLVVLLWQAWQTSAYLGLGLASLQRAFVDPALPATAFAAKFVFTAVTLGFGFLGGETTPLFFIGAALGNALSQALHVPLALGAGLGMAATFATAAGAPLALSAMAVEMFGKGVLPHALLICALAHTMGGRRRLYVKGSDPFRQYPSNKSPRYAAANPHAAAEDPEPASRLTVRKTRPKSA